MESEDAYYFFLMLLQLGGIIVPLVGIFVLLNKEQNKISSNLMVANIGCLIINSAYFLMLQADSLEATGFLLKIEYMGNFLFYFFFIRFILSYIQLDKKYKWIPWFTYVWLAAEIIWLTYVWNDNWRPHMVSDSVFRNMEESAMDYINMGSGDVYAMRNGFLSVMLLGLIISMLIQRYRLREKKGSEKHHLSRLIIAELVIIVPLDMEFFYNSAFDPVPISSSIAVLLIILSVVGSDIFNVLDVGRGWVFENMEYLFLIVDSEYGYLDANKFAREYIPELKTLRKGDEIPDTLLSLFQSGETDYESEGRYYEKMVTPLMQGKTVRGYCLILADLTRQYKMMDELNDAKMRAEDANQAKSAFISNMSHEIRTPMNAIVGMTEILLRSELKEQEKGYLLNIKNSGAALLTIINDILDFSKIESGKLEIMEDTYEPMSMFGDLGMIFLNRIGDKQIELLFDIDRELPLRLYGDALRIRQIIINLANNAIKFTETGYVKLTVRLTPRETDMIWMDVTIQDTGQGIKREDMDKLFGSFQQVDTRKNRNKEGTGLGLAISRQLVELMGGEIGVRSEYGKGSEFYFRIPQKVMSEQKAAVIREEAVVHVPVTVGSFMKSSLLTENLKNLAKIYGLKYVDFQEIQETQENVDFFFADESGWREINDSAGQYISAENTEICILRNPMLDNRWDSQITIVNKPLYSLNFCQIINHDSSVDYAEQENHINFTAPEAEILIVDDNEMNLKVAAGLLQPLQMKIDTADSGKKAIEMIQKKKYHIVFMDHMMPVMDGVETTQRIRALDGEYFRSVPVIALTANAVIGARETFLEAGMNDFVAKPIEIREICKVIRSWLPDGLIRKTSGSVGEVMAVQRDKLPVIEGLNVEEGVKNSGSPELFLSLLGDFYKLIDMKSVKIEKCLADGLIRDYTIEVHALKNTARMIGALELSEWFYKMEQCSNAEDVDTLRKETPAVMELYRSYKPVLEPYGRANEQDKREVSGEEIIEVLHQISEAMDTFDLDSADAALSRLEEYKLPEQISGWMEELRAYIADVAMEEVMAVTRKMTEALEEMQSK